jgi:hypothetical protein
VTSSKPLTFSATDDAKLADVKEDMERIEEVGEIIVKIYRGGEAEDKTKTAIAGILKLPGVDDTVHEKALKGDAKSHSTS